MVTTPDNFDHPGKSSNGRAPRSPIPNGPYINVLFTATMEANVGPNRDGTRVLEHKLTAESKMLSCQKSLTLRHVWDRSRYDQSAHSHLKSTEIDISLPMPEEVKRIRENSRKYFPEINLVICFVAGDYFVENGKQSDTVAYAYKNAGDNHHSPLYTVLICDQAQPIACAHELGHILNYSNKNGLAHDPNPHPDNPDHSANPNNLMYPIPGSIITSEQCRQFFESTIILQN
ncbi:hypothetical protein M3182_04275 [Mesobacillus maritimus]|uniref:hypothetical protein n=1 Tax=Mesobacillus maritimus TaxID=1643336 RepID=UPI00203EE583|nr:hypothetical protein [Mesobacillus maritimus]MCM3584962.1 hypothetical protein [Mesobacillus maritimus]